MQVRIFQFNMRGRVSKQDARVRFGRRNVYVAEIRSTLRVKAYPKLEAFDGQVFQVDVAPQIQRVKIFDAHRSQQTIDLTKLFAGAGIEELNAEHLDCLRRNRRMRLSDFCADTVSRQRAFDLIGHVAIDRAHPISDQHDQDEDDHKSGDNDPRDHCMATRKTP